jgi:photosystem II stability/assembly factor-like uncharacterized protein
MASAKQRAISRYARLTSPEHGRLLIALTALAIAATSFALAFRQTIRPDPFRPATLAERLLYPMQANAFAQGQVIRSDLRTVFALPDGEHVWAAGSGGLLLRSTDGGRTWEKGVVVEADSATRERVLGVVDPEVSRTGGTQPGTPATIDSAGPPEAAPTAYSPAGRKGRAAAWSAWLGPRPLAAQQSDSARPVQQQYSPQQQQAPDTSFTRQSLEADTTRADQAVPPSEGNQGQDPRFAQADSAAAAPLTATVLDVLFADSLHGWAVDEDGGALVTWDGGRRWTHVPGLLPGQPAIRPGAAPTAADSTAERMVRHLSRAVRPDMVPFTAMSWSNPQVGVGIQGRTALMWTPDGGEDWGPGVVFGRLEMEAITSAPLGMGQVAWAASRSEDGTWSVTRSRSAAWTNIQVTRQFPAVTSLVALDSLRVLAFTRDGRMLRTLDGGVTWPDTVPMGRVSDAFFSDEQNGWAVGDHGTVYSTSDGGASWRLLAGGGQRLAGVAFADRRAGWAVGSGGVILATRSGGQRWTPQESGTRNDLYDVHALSPDMAIAVGAGGTILRTGDGGASWDTAAIDSFVLLYRRPDVRSVHFSNAANGWAPVDFGTVLATSDGGRSWRGVPVVSTTSNTPFSATSNTPFSATSNTPVTYFTRLSAVHALDPQHVIVAGDNNFIASTRNGGRSWTVTNNPAQVNLEAVFLLGRRERSGTESNWGWAVGEDGAVLAAGADSAWRRTPVPTTATLTDVRFTSPDTGWIAGHDGVLLGTTDGGVTWQSVSSGTRADLLALAAAEGRTWAVGEGATVLARRPGGAWEAIGRPGTWWPAPWYLATWVVVLGLVAVAARPVPPPALPEGVAGIAANDRPLEDEGRDAFQLREVSAVISRFLRNDRTDPPLTLAITGPWGSGKTSLMNLVCADLQRNRWRPVLFNAWHHQTEEHLLAALLENVRAQAIPGPFRLDGLRFRWRLFWIRFGRFRPVAIVALLLGFLYVGYLSAEPGRVGDVVDSFTSPSTPGGAKAACKQVLSSRCLEFGLRTVLPGWEGLTALLGALAVLATVGRTVRAFGANPATLLRKAAEGTHLRSLEEQTSFRYRFAREFEEVTEALKPNDVVIFVDDLDRCRPKHVLDVLEGINFLVSSGRCVVIMGMDPERVVRCVGLGFRDEAEEVVGELPAGGDAGKGADGAGAGDRLKRSTFARQYLEKLVNIEVPIPTPGAHHFAALAEGDEPRADQEPDALDRASRWVERHGAQVAWVAVAVGMLLLGRFLFAPLPAPQTPLEAEAPAIAAAGTTPAAATQPADSLPRAGAPAEARRRARPGDYIAREAEKHSTLVVWVGLLLALLLAWRRLANRAEPTLQDSQAFRVALKAWAPYVARQRTTPRAFKKFLNRVRYYAMRQRAAEPPAPRWRRFLDRLTGESRDPGLRQGSIPEEVLVALAALHECEPHLVEDAATYSTFRRVAEKCLADSGLSKEEWEKLAYRESIDPAFRKRFAELTVGVRVS